MSALRSLPLVLVTGAVALAAIVLVLAQPTASPLSVDHVYLAAGASGLRVVDVTEPMTPTEVSSEPALGTTSAVAVDSGIAYAAEGAGGMQAIDVSTPDSPTQVGSLGGEADDIAVSGGYAYLVNSAGLRVVDISNPANPNEVGFLQGGASRVAAADGFAYVTTLFGLQSVDVTEPMTPTAAGLLFGRAVAVTVADDTAYLADPIRGLRIVDVSDPGAMTDLGNVPLSGDPSCVAVDGSLVYFGTLAIPAGPSGGLHIIDVSQASNPQHLASFTIEAADVAAHGDTVYVVSGAGALSVIDVSDPAQPEVKGTLLSPSWSAIRVARDQSAEPAATSTPTETVTSTATSTPSTEPTATTTVAPTATAGPTDTSTATSTATALEPTSTATSLPATSTATPRPPTSTPTPTLTATPFAKPTRDPARSWLFLDPSNSPLAHRMVPYVSVAADGTVWIRTRSPTGGEDAVASASPLGVWNRYSGLRSAVEKNAQAILSQGDLRDFWGVDGEGRIWIGAEYYRLETWEVEGRDDLQVGGAVRLEQRVALDDAGRAWVPFRTIIDCPPPRLCLTSGARAYTSRGKGALDLTLSPAPEASRFGAPVMSLVTRPGSGTASTSGGDGPAGGEQKAAKRGRAGTAPFRPAQVPRKAWLVGRRALYELPLGVANPYPGLSNLFARPQARNAGFAGAATLKPDDNLEVFTWIEEHSSGIVGPRVVTHKVYANSWGSTGWGAREDLTAAPIFPEGVRYDTIVAADYGPEGSLWVGTTGGRLGVRAANGSWRDVFTPADSLLAPDERILDVAVGLDGTVWIGTERGLLVYGDIEPPPPSRMIYLPTSQKP